MTEEKSFLMDVGLSSLPFPIRVPSRNNPDGQYTIAEISIQARIMQEFEARWIDKFIQIIHRHRDRIGADTIRTNIVDYLAELKASMVRTEFQYPFFVEKLTPISREKCLVKYQCSYSAKTTASDHKAMIAFRIDIPIITTYPGSVIQELGGLFGQLSVVSLEIHSREDMFPEDLVEMVDRHALAPVYSFLTPDDQAGVIKTIHSSSKSSVTVTDGIKDELASNPSIDWYAVRCVNHGMLHPYTTVIGTEKSMWVPFSGYEAGEI